MIILYYLILHYTTLIVFNMLKYLTNIYRKLHPVRFNNWPLNRNKKDRLRLEWLQVCQQAMTRNSRHIEYVTQDALNIVGTLLQRKSNMSI